MQMKRDSVLMTDIEGRGNTEAIMDYVCKHPIKDDYPGCWGVSTFASNTKSHDDKGRGRPGDCLLRREQDQLQTAPV